ncbi:MAG TPA: TlpA disulfide reductase family protein [Kofleriaceae bacterium]|jgi:thiol-disulfide isomerase/thioredoxin|nr:TlpA disulfide reductase family protein [Kofleriaceae bacterium]
MIEHEAPRIEVMASAGATPGKDAGPTPAPEPAPRPAAPGNSRWFTRLGLAIVHPRWALTIAADRDHTGRAESDLIAALGLLLAATKLGGLAAAVWLGSSVSPGLGVRAAMSVIAGAIKVDLGLLVVGALVVFGLAGARRNLGRAFDLACVAALPLVFVDLGATVVVRATGIAAVPGAVGSLLAGLSYGWMGALIVLAVRPARRAPVHVPAPPAGTLRLARRFGGGVAAVAALGIVTQIVWIAGNLDLVKPMKTGAQAPALALAQIGPTGALGAPVTLASMRGKVTVLDFWATWCNPCVVSMPRLERLARSHPDVVVLAINLDDPAAARALFDEHGYTKMTLLADDGDVSQRYGVSLIPHTVVIDRSGVVRDVVRGTSTDLAAIVEAAGTSD